MIVEKTLMMMKNIKLQVLRCLFNSEMSE